MKKTILFFVISLLGAMSLSAQTATISNPNLKIKRLGCMAQGNDVYIDFVLSNVSSVDFKDFAISVSGKDAFDDEGNNYHGTTDTKYSPFQIMNRLNRWEFCSRDVNLPAEVSMKFHLVLHGVPQSATEISRLDMFARWWGANQGEANIKLTEIPINRE